MCWRWHTASGAASRCAAHQADSGTGGCPARPICDAALLPACQTSPTASPPSATYLQMLERQLALAANKRQAAKEARDSAAARRT